MAEALRILLLLTDRIERPIILEQEQAAVLSLGHCRGSGAVVAHLLAKEKVAGPNPVFRSRGSTEMVEPFATL